MLKEGETDKKNGMKVCLTGFGKLRTEEEVFVQKFTQLAQKNPGPFTLVDKPSEADLILCIYGAQYPENMTREQKKLLYERANDFYVFESGDLALFAYQGVYCALGKHRGRNKRFRSYCVVLTNDYIEEAVHQPVERDLFFSFLGGSTSWIRKRIYRLNFNRPDILIRNTSYHQEWSAWSPEWEKNKRDYVKIMARTRFVICPRGATPTAGRMYEGMQLGRAIVVISDDFIAPTGPDWPKFMIQVPEKDISRLPEILAPYEAKSEEMGRIARMEWEKWFAPNLWFQRIVENCIDISKTRTQPESSHLWKIPYLQAARKTRLKSYTLIKGAAVKFLRATRLAKRLHLNQS